MTDDGGFSRRTFLHLLAWSGVAGLPSALARAAGQSPAPHSGIALYTRPVSAAAVGAEFIRLRPEEADGTRLLHSLGLPTSSRGLESSVVERRLLPGLLKRHRLDFREGRTVKLEGWTLSLTELRLCALVNLSHRST